MKMISKDDTEKNMMLERQYLLRLIKRCQNFHTQHGETKLYFAPHIVKQSCVRIYSGWHLF